MTENKGLLNMSKLNRDDVERIAEEARESGGRPYLARLDLSDIDLAGADLAGADLTKASLVGANLFGASLTGANLFGANLTRASLAGANLAGADLLETGLLALNTWSGPCTVIPVKGVWEITIGCWSGLLNDLDDLIADRAEWPEAKGEERELRRPVLAATVALIRAYIQHPKAEALRKSTEETKP